jgi:hypothetical protein
MKIIVNAIGESPKIAGFSGSRITLGRSLPTLEKGEAGDVVLVHRNDGGRLFRTNIPRKFTYSEEDTWGYEGGGPHCLTENILFHFTGSENETESLCLAFGREVVSKLPIDESCVLHKEFVQAWIEFQKNKIAAEAHSANPA